MYSYLRFDFSVKAAVDSLKIHYVKESASFSAASDHSSYHTDFAGLEVER